MTLTKSRMAGGWRLISGVSAMMLATVWFPASTHAQLSDSLSTQGSRNRTPAALPQRTPAPPALPGAQSGGALAPSQRVPLDMPPTEALFDGVNRGDIEAVRDALARGAELNARNILGITATEMAIDLGRNDIAFLLLSMRNFDRQRNARSGTPGSSVGTAQNTAQTRAPAPAPRPRTTPARAESATREYVNDAGTPAPSAGFLGFDERSASRYR